MVPMPWKNGGGITYELAAFPEGAPLDGFLWRISMAEVASDGPFSAFTGIDRTLTLMTGTGLVLDFAGAEILLDSGAPPLSFPGEAPVTGCPVDGPILDLNVMTRRGAVSHLVVPVNALPGDLPKGVVAVVARGNGRVDDQQLAPGEAVLAEPNGDLSGLEATGDLLAVQILPYPLAGGAK